MYTVCFLLLLPRGGVVALAVGVMCACHLERRGMQQPWRSHAGSGRAPEIRPSQPELQELTKRRNNFFVNRKTGATLRKNCIDQELDFQNRKAVLAKGKRITIWSAESTDLKL